ncbi:hypothetical protein V6N12_021170 [Hibiscus sabdariffa]|uniref:Uncharacterized protein n=1 Tax=Hibiscus sabdariffa TaxID=183260 RepID=A0ABR2ABV2_9ROSI
MNLVPRPYYPINHLVDMGRKNMQQRRHELVVVQGPIEPEGETIGHGGVPYVEARFSDLGEDIGGAYLRVSFGGLVVHEMCVDEGDGETFGCKLDGQVNGRDDVALERVSYEDCMEVLGCHW